MHPSEQQAGVLNPGRTGHLPDCVGQYQHQEGGEGQQAGLCRGHGGHGGQHAGREKVSLFTNNLQE